MKKISIAIDGPAGSGKSTVSKLLARCLGLAYVDTGAMYRGVALLAKRAGVSPGDVESLARIAGAAEFDFRMDQDEGSLLNRVFLNGEEVTDEIREPEISQLASKVSAAGPVRSALVSMQKKMGERGGVVMEGRDICGVVLPDAEVKIFMDASPEERARRRFIELRESGRDVDFEQVLADIRERDHRDSTREDSPLRVAPGALVISTDGLSIAQVVEKIAAIADRAKY